MADKCYRRVIIEVTDDAVADETLYSHKMGGHHSNTPLFPFNPNSYTDIEILSYNTLSLSEKNHRGNINLRTNEIMSFDCVGRSSSDRLVRGELEHMFDMLLFNQRNCSLVNFKPERKLPTSFFQQILVPEVDKRLALLRDTLILQSIKLEYCDVQKYDVINMFEKSGKGPPSNRTTQNSLQFNNTREFLLWTRHFGALWRNALEHDSFDVEFILLDAPNELNGTPAGIKEIKVRLSLLNIYLDKMDWNMRSGLKMFFKSMQQPNVRVNHSIVTDCLREYFFNENDQWLVWMLFSVPQVNYGTSLVNYMLSLAEAACGSSSQNMSITDTDIELRLLERNEVTKATRMIAGHDHDHDYVIPSSDIGVSTNFGSSKKFPNALSFWFYHVNDGFEKVMENMKKYYDRKNQLKIESIIKDQQPISRTLVKDIGIPNLGFLADNNINHDELLQTYLKRYQESLSDYRKVLRKIERTKYAGQLKISIARKNYEITKYSRDMRARLMYRGRR